MGVCISVCRSGTAVRPSMPVVSTDDRSRVELAARINLQKQAKVPRLDISKNVLYAQRKERHNSQVSSSSVSRVNSAEPV